jgi:hypothetical protein
MILVIIGLATLSALGLIALGLFDAMVAGFVMSKFWQWYAVPLGYRAKSWALFAAALIVIGLVRGVSRGIPPLKAHVTQDADEEGEEEDDGASHEGIAEAVAHFAGYLMAPWFALLVGWVLK